MGFAQVRYRFGQFELDRTTRELWREGRKIPLQQQPLQILELLLDRAGGVVTREEIRQAVWPEDSHGQFDAGVGNSIRKIRVALGDDADNPRFVETLPKVGFRFIAPVSVEIPAGPAEAIPPVVPPSRRWVWLVVAAAFVVAAFTWYRTGTPTKPNLAGTRPIAALGGRPSHPALSPGGEMLAFDWEGPEDEATAVYVQRIGDSSPARLTPGKIADFWPVWSPDGKQIAYFRETTPAKAQVEVMPAGGGVARVLFEVDRGRGERPRLNWSADGKWLVSADRPAPVEGKRQASYLVLFSFETGQKRALTRPEADWRGDSEAVFSPDSKKVAFRRTRPTSGDEDIFEVPVEGGEAVAVTHDRKAIAALEYTPDRGLLISSRRGGWLRNFWWSPPGGGPLELVSDPAFDLGSPTVSRNGKHLAYVKVQFDVNLWKLPIDGGAAEPVLPSEFVESNPAFSGDGQKIAFVSGRTGTMEIWVAGVNGAGASQVTTSEGNTIAVPQLSPDGKQIAFEWRPKGREGIYVMSSGGGGSRQLVMGLKGESIPRWSRDGSAVYFNSERSGRQEVWRVPIAGGEPVQVTSNGGCAGTESVDRKTLYYAKPGVGGIWAAKLDDNRTEKRVVDELDPADCGNFAIGDGALVYIERSGENRNRGTIVSVDLATGKHTPVHVMRAPPLFNGSGLALSPDGKTILFAEVDRDGTSIYGK